MRRILRSTTTLSTALSVALGSFHTLPARAQVLAEDGSVLGPDGALLCSPTADQACDLEAIAEALQAEAVRLEAEAAAQAAAEEAARLEAEAAAQAAAEEAARLEAEAAAQAAAEEAARLEAEAAAQAAAEEAARLEAEAAAQAAAEEAARLEAEAAAQAAAEEAVRLEAEAAAQAAAEEAARLEAEAVAEAGEESIAEEVPATQAPAEAEPAEGAAPDPVPSQEPEVAPEDQPATEPGSAPAAEAEAAPTTITEAAPPEAATGEAGVGEAANDLPEGGAVEEGAEVGGAVTGEADSAPDAETSESSGIDASGSAASGAETPDTESSDTASPEAATSETDASDPVAEAVPAEAPAQGAEAEDPPLVTAEPAPAAQDAPEAVDAPVPEAEAVESLLSILAPAAEATAGEDPAEGAEAMEGGSTATALAPVVAAAAAALLLPSGEPEAGTPGEGAPPQDGPAAEALLPVTVVTEEITAETARASSEEFAAAPVAVGEGRKSGLSDLEKVGLVALGALAVGAIINAGNKDEKRVVSATGDRVVVENADGSHVVYKDDDAVLRQPGVRSVTETYRDGSTRTIVERPDGARVVTVRDASGRVLHRSSYDRHGIETVLIDDLHVVEQPIIVSELPRPRPDRVTISTSDQDAALKAELAAIEAEGLGRKFSLRQIREIAEVRALAATIEVDQITFDTGSAAIRASEARKLADLGRLVESLLAADPSHVFLIEGHTDAIGSAASNLLLSDRRAESLALALSEYFGIPPENLVVQGYGESELKIDTQEAERANRRVVVRLITPLMRSAELR
ncbi:OmpA family protein [Pseudogemmobacter sonorensis]|uniref:OmpA family protein n=1 Tax=Pseudogemmobacter sonorensis TaxID=2989681 RepID=UPI0036934A3C